MFFMIFMSFVVSFRVTFRRRDTRKQHFSGGSPGSFPDHFLLHVGTIWGHFWYNFETVFGNMVDRLNQQIKDEGDVVVGRRIDELHRHWFHLEPHFVGVVLSFSFFFFWQNKIQK